MQNDPQNLDDFDEQQLDPLKKSANTGITGGANWGPITQASAAQPSSGAFNRDQFRDTLMGSVHNTTDLSNFVNAHQGDYGAGVKLLPGGKGDKIVLPDGSVIDAVLGAGVNGGQGSAWTGAGTMGANGQMIPQAAGGGGGASAAQGGGGQLDGAFRDALLKAMQGANTPYDPNAPQNASQQNAYNFQRDRAAQQARGAMAERAAFSGLNSGGSGSGAFDSGLDGMYEQAGQDKAGEAANLAQQDFQSKRQDLSHALDLANSVGARQEAAALQMQLAQLDNQYRYAALGQQQGQFEDSMAFNWNDWLANQNRNSLLAGMNG